MYKWLDGSWQWVVRRSCTNDWMVPGNGRLGDPVQMAGWFLAMGG